MGELAQASFLPTANALLWTANIDGNQDIHIYALGRAQGPVRFLCLTGINWLGRHEAAFSHDGSRLLYMHEGPNAPNDIWDYDFATAKSPQITHSLVGGCALKTWWNPS